MDPRIREGDKGGGGLTGTRASEAKGPFPGGKRVGSRGKKKNVKERKREKKVWSENQRIDIRRSIKKVAWNYLFLLADEDAAWIGGFAAVEFKQQIQSWEAEGFNMRAAAWACAGKNVSNAIAIAIVDSNARAACEVFCVGIKLRK